MKNNFYANPINPPMMVEVPLWEYKDLVKKAAQLDMLLTMTRVEGKYSAGDMLVAMVPDVSEVDEDGV